MQKYVLTIITDEYLKYCRRSLQSPSVSPNPVGHGMLMVLPEAHYEASSVGSGYLGELLFVDPSHTVAKHNHVSCAIAQGIILTRNNTSGLTEKALNLFVSISESVPLRFPTTCVIIVVGPCFLMFKFVVAVVLISFFYFLDLILFLMIRTKYYSWLNLINIEAVLIALELENP